jgi:hypothetical protein
MDNEAISLLKEDFRSWSGGFSPESVYQITVYVDYAMNTDLGTPEEIREALLDWIGSDDPDDDLEKAPDPSKQFARSHEDFEAKTREQARRFNERLQRWKANHS